MARIVNRCKETIHDILTPTYITHELIIKAVEIEKPKEGIAGELAAEEEIVLKKVQTLHLERLSIMKISNLMMMCNLTKLSLSNNRIDKIEYLNSLIHLRDLDLSFNRIEMIENLDELLNLKILSLYSNEIYQIENLIPLKKLLTLNIGKNRILNRENIFYLRKFKKLRYFNMEGNECAESTDFRLFVVTFLPQITYYEYMHVTPSERIEGNKIYKRRLQEVEDDEMFEVLLKKKEEAEEDEMERHDATFMEFLSGSEFFNSLFEKDEDGRMFRETEKIRRRCEVYEVEFLEHTKKFYTFGMKKYAERQREIERFHKAVQKTHQENYQLSQDVISRFYEQKLETMRIAEFLSDDAKSEEQADIVTLSEIYMMHLEYFNEIVNETKVELIGLEMILTQRIQELNTTFEKALTEHITDFVYDIKYYFAEFTVIVEYYILDLEEIVKELAELLTKEEHPYIPDEIIPCLEDKSKAQRAFSNTYRIQTQLVRRRQNRMVSRAKKWLANKICNLQQEETVRNRHKIIEINHFLDCSRDEYEQKFNPIRPEISAALDN